MEQSLAKANFLNTSDFTVVQALALFLLVVRRHDESRFAWSLTGLVIRIAQGLGLHRDGTNFGLSPYETEQRRRLWWAIVTLDFRSSEEMGTDLILTDGDFDTQLPSNINDSDITPTATEYPAPRLGRSETAISLVRFEVCAMSRRLHDSSNSKYSCGKTPASTVAEKERILVEFYQRIEEKFLRHLDEEVDALYWVAAMISRIIMAKMCLLVYQPMLFPGSDYELTADIRERIYIASIEIIQYNHWLNTDARCKQYRWLFRTYTNWHAIAYILVETCRRPWSPLVERGWEAVNGYDKDLAENIKRADHAAVFLPLRKLFTRAKRYQESEVARLRANPEEARRLDLAERTNPSQTQYDPIPDIEARIQQVRDRWRAMVHLDASTPASFHEPQQPQQQPQQQQQQTAMVPLLSKESQPLPPQATVSATTSPHYQQPQVQPQSSPDTQMAMGMSDISMEYMDAFMAQSNFAMAELWNVGTVSMNNGNNNEAAALNMGGRQQDQGQGQGQGNVLAQQPMMQQQDQRVKNDHHVPPYLWPENFAAPNPKFEMEDADMLGADFNWHDWSQSIRGLGMEGTQSKQSW